MKTYRNIFKEKTEQELIVLYSQYLESEKPGIGYIPDNELGKIRDEYWEMCKVDMLWTLQTDLMRAIADLWYKDKTCNGG